MRKLVLILGLWFAAFPASAQNVEIRDIIRQQIEALRADDFDQAFTYASPSIKGIFGNSARFGQMVSQGYPMVYRPGSFSFKDQEANDTGVFQYVLFEDQAGRFFMAQYSMIEIDGGWKINGVQILEAPLVGT